MNNDPYPTEDLLIELGLEELPPRSLQPLINALAELIQEALNRHQLNFSKLHRYATPRRLALLVQDLQCQQADTESIERGPQIAKAFDSEGRPTKAAEGFARAHHLDISELQLEAGEQGRIYYSRSHRGQSARVLIPTILTAALNDLPMDKRMRWGSHSFEFVRPLHWLVILLGNSVLEASIFGIQASDCSRGHRIQHPEAIPIKQPKTYVQQLWEQGKVIVDMNQRRNTIIQQVKEEADKIGGEAIVTEELLDEVNALVECPFSLSGQFDPNFLSLPKEVLISTMQTHQKYFPVADKAGKLLPYFITVANIESPQPELIIRGNEKVIQPRLQDAAFFYQGDLKIPLEQQRNKLQTVVFQHQLGSLQDKTERLIALGTYLCQQLDTMESIDWVQRAASLSKSDLITAMVQEFPELQGVMGSYYARHQGEPDAVCRALKEHYLPRFSNDKLPESKVGIALSLADRIDTLSGIFGIGNPPSGSRDPFSLRRHSFAIIRILIEKSLYLDLEQLIAFATAQHRGIIVAPEQLHRQILNYILDRLRSWLEEQGIDSRMFQAVKDLGISNLMDFYQRVLALKKFMQLPQAQSLISAHKRVHNILNKSHDSLTTQENIDRHLLQLEPERELAEIIDSLDTDELLQNKNYLGALQQMAQLKQPVDQFFDQVMVMVDDTRLRNNRLLLLQQLNASLSKVANLSRLLGK